MENGDGVRPIVPRNFISDAVRRRGKSRSLKEEQRQGDEHGWDFHAHKIGNVGFHPFPKIRTEG